MLGICDYGIFPHTQHNRPGNISTICKYFPKTFFPSPATSGGVVWETRVRTQNINSFRELSALIKYQFAR